jgi:hypothetical protein
MADARGADVRFDQRQIAQLAPGSRASRRRVDAAAIFRSPRNRS